MDALLQSSVNGLDCCNQCRCSLSISIVRKCLLLDEVFTTYPVCECQYAQVDLRRLLLLDAFCLEGANHPVL